MELVGLVENRVAERRSPHRHLLGPLTVSPADRRRDPSLIWATEAIQPHIPKYLSLLAELAVRHRSYILAGSLPVRQSDGSLTNTAFFFAPDGGVSSQDKMVLTRWEREVWNMRAGKEVRVFDTEFGAVGVDICYDVEFPNVARMQAEARARIILAPCCCDSLRGCYRVRVGARARALENQAYVIQSPAIGNADWIPTFGSCVGFAGVYGPPDLGPRESGVIAQGQEGQEGWVYGDLDLTAIDRIRGGREVANSFEWTAHTKIGPAVRAPFEEIVSRGVV
jgi:predicted amidohydrolase